MSSTEVPTDHDTREAAPRIAASFGLVDVALESLSRFNPVFRARTVAGTDVVLKRAARAAESVAAWAVDLAATGVGVVTPVVLPVPNPQHVDGAAWVVYPYVEGKPYAGGSEQIAAAGALLGRMHGSGADADGVMDYEWPGTDLDEVESDLDLLGGVLSVHAADTGPLAAGLGSLGRDWHAGSLPRLRAADHRLPRVGASMDFKATNLVYAGEVTLIDPDSAEVVPRLLDLALAAVLFHNECPTAPPRLFSAEEWTRFVSAYLSRVELTVLERRLWPDAVAHMLWEEGTWALEDNDEEAWADPHQRAFLLDLAGTSPDRFPLPS